MFDKDLKILTEAYSNIRKKEYFPEIKQALKRNFEELQVDDPEWAKELTPKYERIFRADNVEELIQAWQDLAWDAPSAINFASDHVDNKEELSAILGEIGMTFRQWDT